MENLGIDYRLIISQLINLAVFYFIFSKFIAKPFFKYIEKEKNEEARRQKLLVELEQGEATLQNKEKDLMDKVKKERTEIIDEAKKDAEKVKADILAQAEKDADATLAKGKEQVAEERSSLQREMKEQLAHLSTMLVRKALGEYLTGDAQKKVTENILQNLPNETKKA